MGLASLSKRHITALPSWMPSHLSCCVHVPMMVTMPCLCQNYNMLCCLLHMQQVPNQQLLRLYGENARVDANGDAAIDAQVSQALYTDFSSQLQQRAGANDISTPWRVLGLFPSTCLSCSDSSQCGALACAVQVCGGSCLPSAVVECRCIDDDLVVACCGNKLLFMLNKGCCPSWWTAAAAQCAEISARC